MNPFVLPHLSAGSVIRRAGLLTCLTLGLSGVARAQVLPPKPDMTCTVSPTDFTGWFDKQPGADQPVKAANSIGLDTGNNCNFYKWSEQMFLWVTSPATGTYRGGRVFNSQVFYEVRGNDLVRQGDGPLQSLFLRPAKSGPDGLPVVIDQQGHLREFVTAPDRPGSGAPDAALANRHPEIATIRPGAGGQAEFLNGEGRRIENFRPVVTPDMLPESLGRLAPLATPDKNVAALNETDVRQNIAKALTDMHILIRFDTRSGPAFVEAGTGKLTDLGPGQAGGNGVLISQKNDVVYYETLVNDVYAWYLTGRMTPNGILPTFDKNRAATEGLFPTTDVDLASIIGFSQSHGGPTAFPDQQALAVELKLAWVAASSLPNNANGYITTKGDVPTYDKSNSADWAPTGSQVITLALVGTHIAGSANGHPEMVWATFEHQANTPLAQFQYNSGGQPVTVPQNTAGNWLFAANGATPPFNVELAKYCADEKEKCDGKKGHIIAYTAAKIGPNNILRQKPWGVASDGQPNQEDTTPAAANTEIVSLDTDVRAKLTAAGATADPRFNYLLIGATWTEGGFEPTCPFPIGQGCTYTTAPVNPASNQIGTSYLENSTMETFYLGSDTTVAGKTLNCLDCHQSKRSHDPTVKATTAVSHVFAGLNPLPTFLPRADK